MQILNKYNIWCKDKDDLSSVCAKVEMLGEHELILREKKTNLIEFRIIGNSEMLSDICVSDRTVELIKHFSADKNGFTFMKMGK